MCLNTDILTPALDTVLGISWSGCFGEKDAIFPVVVSDTQKQLGVNSQEVAHPPWTTNFSCWALGYHKHQLYVCTY